MIDLSENVPPQATLNNVAKMLLLNLVNEYIYIYKYLQFIIQQQTTRYSSSSLSYDIEEESLLQPCILFPHS